MATITPFSAVVSSFYAVFFHRLCCHGIVYAVVASFNAVVTTVSAVITSFLPGVVSFSDVVALFTTVIVSFTSVCCTVFCSYGIVF